MSGSRLELREEDPPPRAAALAMAAALALAGAGTLFAEGSLFACALPLAAWAALSLARGKPEPRLSARRELSAGFAEAGEGLRVELRVRNEGARIELLRLSDGLPPGAALLEGETAWAGSLDAGAETELRYAISFGRGLHSFGPLRAEAEDPFSASKSMILLDCPGEVAVYPKRIAAKKLAYGAGATRLFGGQSRSRRSGGGSEFYGTRDYLPGDPVRRLNWKAEARWGKPVLNVFEEERAIDIGLVLDARSVAYKGEGQFEAALCAAAAYAELFLAEGNRLSFLRYGSCIDWLPPGAGRQRRIEIRRALAGAQLGSHAAFESFEALPPSIFPPKSAILFVSPLLRGDALPLRCLRERGYSVAVLRVEAGRGASAAGTGLGLDEKSAALHRRILGLEDALAMAMLLESGIKILRWDSERELGAARLLPPERGS